MVKLKIDELMKQRGITNASDFARKAGMSRTTLNRLREEDLSRVDLNNLERLCRALNCSVLELIAITNPDGTLFEPEKAE